MDGDSPVLNKADSEYTAFEASLMAEWKATHTELPPLIYHYTSANALLSILENRILRATDIRYLNDSMELSYGYGLAHSLLREILEKASSKLIDQSDVLYSTLGKISDEMSIYVACFCEEGNLLSQWRGYSNGVGGYSFGIDPAQLLQVESDAPAKNVYLRKVIYQESAQKKWLLKLFNEAFKIYDAHAGTLDSVEAETLAYRMIYSLAIPLFEFMFSFKHKSFAEEEEWRVVVAPFEPYKRANVKFVGKADRISPYLELDFSEPVPKGFGELPLRALTYGPTPHPELARRSLTLIAERFGYSGVTIEGSDIPLRAG